LIRKGKMIDVSFVDIGRLWLNRKNQKEGIEGLRRFVYSGSKKIAPIFAGAAIKGLFVIFYDIDDQDYLRTN
jgi:hypothetical protein